VYYHYLTKSVKWEFSMRGVNEGMQNKPTLHIVVCIMKIDCFIPFSFQYIYKLALFELLATL